jgi:CRISPR-associated endoribonuclease Cas6
LRARIIFGLLNKGASVPFHHQYLIAGFIEGLIKRHLADFTTSTDLYNFSGLKGQIKVGKDGLYFYSSKITLVFSSPDQTFMDKFLEKLFQMPQVEIGKLQLTPLQVEKEQMPVLTEEMKFLCISPMVAIHPEDQEEDPKKFIVPSADIFSDLLYEDTILRMEKAGYSAEQLESFFRFQIVPDKEYLSKIKDGDKKFARVFPVYYGNEKYEVRGYTLPFTLYADPEVQKFVLTNGLGYMSNKGFGMLDIANSDPNLRSTPYPVLTSRG